MADDKSSSDKGEPKPQRVDIITSFAQREGDNVRVVLALPRTDSPGRATVPVRLVTGKRRLDGQAAVSVGARGTVLETRFPQSDLGRAAWRIAFQPEDDAPYVRVRARLLAHPDLPVALLPGPAPATKQAPLKPAGAGEGGRPSGLRRRAVQGVRAVQRRVQG